MHLNTSKYPIKCFSLLIIYLDCFPFKSRTPSFIEDMYNCLYYLCPNIEIKLLIMQHIINTFYNGLIVLLYYFVIFFMTITWIVCLLFNPCFSQKLFESITFVLPIVVIFEFHHGISCWLQGFCLHIHKKHLKIPLLSLCNKKNKIHYNHQWKAQDILYFQMKEHSLDHKH